MVSACPAAIANQKTGEPVNKHAVYTVFEERCYDDDPEDTWSHSARLSKSALSTAVMEKLSLIHISEPTRH
eukprot:5215766-Karenia_brevis.AAC.1